MIATVKQFLVEIVCGAWDSSSAWDKKTKLESSVLATMLYKASTILNILFWVCLHKSATNNIDGPLRAE
jgi:hypothetical protein